MKSVFDIKKLEGVPVLVRASLNVPTVGNTVLSSFRLRAMVPTIEYLKDKGAKVIVVGHIGRDKNKSLLPVFHFLKEFFPELGFSELTIGYSVRERVAKMLPGDVLLLENVRRNEGEIRNDEAFAKELGSLGDVFVQNAFSDCHRAHASIVGVPKFLSSYAGFSLLSEIDSLSKMINPGDNSLAILGGAKFTTKAALIKSLLDKYDEVFVGGAIVHDILVERGVEIGRSVWSGSTDLVSDIAYHESLSIPKDVVVIGTEGRKVKPVGAVLKTDAIMDAGPQTRRELAQKIKVAKTVLWNGPLGNYEYGFEDGDREILKALAGAKGFSVVGGGDTVASIESMNIEEKISFVSTGGGAMLEYLLKGTLPGIDAIS